MATRKDQLDAFVFARRRMVANLVAPSPTGSDEAAPRPVKTFFTSAILSAIAVAGVAVLGVFKPSAPSGWESGLVVDNSSGAEYVYSPQDKQLHPVVNVTSAKLLLGSSFKKYDVPDSVINGPDVTIGAPIGILNAPPDVPSPGNVDLTQWTLCLDSASHADQTKSGGKTILEIGYGAGSDSTALQNTGFVAHDTNNTNYLIDGDYAYPIQDSAVTSQLVEVSVPQGTGAGPWVSDAWLKAFRPGTPLQLPSVAGLGDPVTAPDQLGRHIGDFGTVQGENGQQSGYYIQTEDGLVQVSAFVYSLYKVGPAGSNGNVRQMSLNGAQILNAKPRAELTSPTSLLNAGSDWPQSLVTLVDTDGKTPGFGVLCAGFSQSYDGDLPHISLYYGTHLPQPLPNGVSVQGTGQTLADYVLVKAGHAALARKVSGGNNLNSGPEYLITETGTQYLMTPSAKLPGAAADSQPVNAAQMLLYDKVQVTHVPQAWMSLVPTGPELDPARAGTTPSLTSN
ncbi:MAG TPA: type VII secretion protein EccB [Actinocrinis sp.]|uniref:type VII secretion protein EccB n=1 Tax=Actinocrinis sp. TaxID=1920516 RepID=UPI002D2A9186|nr:type VII secretion protein EccB [Actinocrinis sp.]HZU57769.1 type VII secretion protein EccB [Actinocrinis sp.]